MRPKVLMLSDGEVISLRKFLRATRDVWEYRRGMAILLKAEGKVHGYPSAVKVYADG